MQLPALIGKYELLEFLGGGMSHVYRGRDTVIGRPVVVKLLTPEACQDQEAKARFLQEAKLAGNLQHDNIVGIFDFGEHDGRPYIVMEYLKGQDLRDAIRGGGTGSLMDRLKIALQIAQALEHVNAQGIVHRDIKPENVHIDANGKVKLMDFGIAKSANLSLTRTGVTMGTPYYMAPEQIIGTKPTEQVDVYAFGLLLYELLTGTRAVNGETMESVMYQILNQPLDPSAMVSAGVPPDARKLVLHCVEKVPENRPAGFSPIVRQLESMVAGESSGSTLPVGTQPVQTRTLPVNARQPAPAAVAEPPKPARSAGPWIGIGALAVALIAGGIWWATRPKPAPVVPTQPTSAAQKPPSIPGMVYIAAGTFLSGETNAPTQLPAFYIDETEVSNGDFAEFCKATGCPAPMGAPDLPVVRATIAQARQFAAWKGKRLPTALEWERAARGTKGSKYPWGDAEDASLANVGGAALKPVKSYAAYGNVYQMAGNAWEMVEGEIAPSSQAVVQFAKLLTPPPTAQEKWIAIRGGSFNTPLRAAVGYEWSPIPERFSSSDIGFRCAK
ncbi:MAG TPA: bifunctional serine/threonine-protein kinase/formylglycine-generating enzyme family protein [Bryobacteraceae bacterium]|nr:bifunctional serine/threonine-protein kinase/formylglycine-generating enzyme family protein [Bryobacteraceae bacterium]